MFRFWKYLLFSALSFSVIEEGAGAAEPEDRGDDLVTDEDPKSDDEEDPKSDDDDEEDPKSDDDEEDPKSDDEEDPKSDDEEEDSKPAGHMIPKSRYDFKAQQAAKYKEDLAALQKKLDTQTEKTGGEVDSSAEAVEELETVLADLAEKQQQATADNDVEAALKYSEQARKAERDFYLNAIKSDNSSTVVSAKDAAVQEIKLDKLLDEVEATYDALNPESKSYDQDTVDEVNDLRESFEAKGYTAANALKRAIGYVMPDQPETKPPGKGGSRKPDIEDKIDAANRNAPDLENAGKDSDALGKDDNIDVTKLTDDEFDKLPESTKKRLRGDNF